jgi:anaerobic glycerol-3-phosphate dehydrogenase C subunit
MVRRMNDIHRKKTKPWLDDIKELIRGEVLDDELTRSMFSSGACLYQVRPLCVIQPREKADVVNVIKYASHRGIPITARGAGTSRTGSELGSGIVLDFSKYMRDIMGFDPGGQWVRVQPGIILSSLNNALKPHRLFFPIDPSTMEFCTIGGMIANNSSGPHAVKYGTTRDHVQSLEVVLSNGEVINTRPIPLKESQTASADDVNTLEGRIYSALPNLLKEYHGPLSEERPFTMKNSSGYELWRLLNNGVLDLNPLLVGSEGTLGIVTEAKLGLTPITGEALSGLVYFDNLDHVGRASQYILELAPSMLEIMERQILDLARKHAVELRAYLPDGIEGVLYVEFHEETKEACLRKFLQLEYKIIQHKKLATDIKVAAGPEDMATFAKVRSISGPILNKIKGPRKPLAFIEDTAVHPTHLTEYIRGLRALFQRFEVEASIYGHAGDGNLHIMVFMDLSREDEVRKMVSLADACYDLVLSLRGTISAEHGDGRLRSYYLKRQYPRLYPAMVEIKKLFDPKNIFNPGCIVGADLNPLNRHLKFVAEHQAVSTGSLFDAESARTQIDTCSGCGKCRSYCPIARQIPEEWATGRAKATILRQIISGELDQRILDSPELKRIMDSCINCKRCLNDCPSGVDIPWLAVGGRSYYVGKHGETLSNRLFTDTRLLGKIGGALAPVANLTSAWRPARRLLEKATGLDQRRFLPQFHRRGAGKHLEDTVQPSLPRQIIYFKGCYARFNASGRDSFATESVLKHNGFHVITPDFRCCGIASISAGSVRRVMGDVRRNLEMMATYVDQGLDIVFDEPSCALAVKMEYPKIQNSQTSKKVAEKCYDIHQFLMKLHKKGELLLDLNEMHLTVGYHNPCHLRALGITREPIDLLQLIPGVQVLVFSDECCGLAGTFGIKRENFDVSMGIGTRLFEEIKRSGVNRVATSCAACNLQIFQGTGKEALHPITLLAEAYEN